jgi:hypothetical protein
MLEAINAAGNPRIRNRVVDIGAYEFETLEMPDNKRLNESRPSR